MPRIVALAFYILLGSARLSLAANLEMTLVAQPPTDAVNHYYAGNRTPLEPSRFLPLPVGCVQPQGWLLTALERERDGLCGHLDEVSPWLDQQNNAWLSPTGQGANGWEELPYWLRGYVELAWVLNDPKMIAASQVWIDGALNSRRPNGDFGPATMVDDGVRDFWPNMTMLFCLETWYESSRDPRVIDLMTGYFNYQLSLPDNKFFTRSWQVARGGDELYSIYWLYNRIGNPDLLKLAARLHHHTSNWEGPSLPSWHNVNIAEGFREPATWWLQSRQPADLQATYHDFHEVRRLYGQVPGGMFGGDEVCRPGQSDPRQAVETCGMVEQMLSDEFLTQFTGDALWADNCENVAFNSLPAALTPDQRALRYLTAPNLVVSDARNHAPGFNNSGVMVLMSPDVCYRCCQHNHGMGWPYLAKNLWLGTPDDGLCADIYSQSTVSAQVGDGTKVTITETTHYPFAGQIHLTLHSGKSVRFPLYLRLPGWCRQATLAVNGEHLAVSTEPDHYLRIARSWNDGDTVNLNLLMQPSVQHWPDNHDSVSVNYGPLTFSLDIGERIEPETSAGKPLDDAGSPHAVPTRWPSYGYFPTTPWNYGLALNETWPEGSFSVDYRPWPADDFPFTPENTPLALTVNARQIPAWGLDTNGLCGVLPPSPVPSNEPVEKVTLIPMGAARLRISAFPTIDANK